MLDPRVVVAHGNCGTDYPSAPPFSPRVAYPEYDGDVLSVRHNTVYEGVRECFRMAGLDAARFGTPQWNPLGELIRPGESVLLKPNLVKERHPTDPQGWRYMITHGSVIRAVADYVFRAVGPEGRVMVADAPQTDSSFDQIRSLLSLDLIATFYRRHGLRFEVIDLRNEEWKSRRGVVVSRRKIAGDPHGYVAFDLADSSELVDHQGAGRYYGADYDQGMVNRHHSGGRHEYRVAAAALEADVIFSLPKLKTHKKAGITVSLKNLVGVNGDKNWLPHHTEAGDGSPGDERPCPGKKQQAERALTRRLRQLALGLPWVGPLVYLHVLGVGRRVFGDTRKVIRSGNWWGNDTVWRMCLDLNKIVLYGNRDGTFREPTPENRKRHFVLVDAIMAGEGYGPLQPDPVPMGTLVFGTHPASVDAACAWLMGFDPERIPIVRQAFDCQQFPLAEWGWRDVRVISNRPEWSAMVPEIPDQATFHFAPSFGWEGHIERHRAELEDADSIPASLS